MAIWLQVFYGVLTVVLIGWGGWMTKLVLKHEKCFAELFERCHGREQWIRAIDTDMAKIATAINKMARNIVRLGMKSGLDKGELETEGDQT